MNRTLTETETTALLTEQLYGHLGCTMDDGRVYIVPMTFAYRDNALYSFTYTGQKIEMLRRHPAACFQTEQFLREGTWDSVIVWGRYEEIPEAEHMQAIEILTERLQREEGRATSALYNELLPKKKDLSNGRERVFFRIHIEEKTGLRVQND